MSEIEDAAVDEPEVAEVESGADDAAVETPVEQQERLYADKYKTTDELEKGYRETDAARTRAQQEAAELREQIAALQAPAEEEPEPFNPLQNYGYDDSDWANIARSVQSRPEDTMNWALAEGDQTVVDATFAYWHSINPLAAQTFAAKLAVTEERQQLEEMRSTIQHEQAAKAAERQAANVKLAVSKINDLPDFDKHKVRVAELISQHALRDDDPRFSDPDQMFDYAYTMYSRAVHEEYQRQAAAQAAAGDEPTPAAKGAKARTQTRSTAAAGASGSDPVTQAYLDAMKASA